MPWNGKGWEPERKKLLENEIEFPSSLFPAYNVFFFFFFLMLSIKFGWLLAGCGPHKYNGIFISMFHKPSCAIEKYATAAQVENNSPLMVKSKDDDDDEHR